MKKSANRNTVTGCPLPGAALYLPLLNLIFILPPARFPDVYREIGEPKECLEWIQEYRSAVFWSFSRKDYQKTNWWSRTARADIGSKLTIRTANTVRKIVRIGKAL